jgi:adenylate kinase
MAASGSANPQVNVLITGTPGTGKTSTAAAVAAATGLRHLDVGAAIKDQSLHCGWDEDFQCHIVDEDKVRTRGERLPPLRRSASARALPPAALRAHPSPQVCDALEEQMSAGGNIVDYHSCGFFPERCALRCTASRGDCS